MVSESDVAAALSAIDPTYELRAATPIERGASSIHRVTLDTPAGTRDCVFKADPADEWDVGVDPRLLAILDAHTDLPVPTVLGVVDDHPEVPSPSYLMTAVGGEDLAYAEVGWLGDDALRTLARQVGRYLGTLHGVEAVDAFGLVRAAGPALSGERPSGDPSTVAVADGYDDAGAFLAAWTDRELDRLADGRFADLTPSLRSWFADRRASLSGPDGPVLTRNDHGLHNLRIDPDSGDLVSIVDWAYTLAAPPAFDLGYATYIYGGAYLAGLPDVPDRTDLVRDALHAGYRETTAAGLEAATGDADYFEVLAAVRLLIDFESLVPQVPDDADIEAMAGRLRADVEAMLD